MSESKLFWTLQPHLVKRPEGWEVRVSGSEPGGTRWKDRVPMFGNICATTKEEALAEAKDRARIHLYGEVRWQEPMVLSDGTEEFWSVDRQIPGWELIEDGQTDDGVAFDFIWYKEYGGLSCQYIARHFCRHAGDKEFAEVRERAKADDERFMAEIAEAGGATGQ